MAHKSQVNGRAAHCTVSVGDSLYVWGGAQLGLPKVHDSEEKRRFTSNIQHFTPSTGQWITRGTTGTPPLGVSAYFCTAINDLLYYFGGWCGHESCYHNSITQLDTVSLQWRELEPTDATRPVMRRGYGGMISFENDGAHHLLMIGGKGSKPAVQLPHYKYIKLPSGRWRTNEHSIYHVSSKKWNSPTIIGQCKPSVSGFIIEKINNTRAVLFGGVETDDEAKSNIPNDIYILEISISTVFWQCIKKSEVIGQWPVGRYHHGGAIITTGSDCPMLVISGGLDKNNVKLSDCWIFIITKHSWIKLNVPHSVSEKNSHSLSVLTMSPHSVWMITDGGFVDESYKFVTHPNITMLTELVLSSKGEWTVGDTLDTNGMNNEEYKKKYQQQLQIVRRIWLEEYQTPRKGDTANIEQTVQALMKSLEEKEREAQVFHQQMKQKEKEEAKKDQKIRRYCHQLQEEKEEAEKEKRHHQQLLQEKMRIEALKNEEIKQYCYQLQEKIQIYCNLLQEKEREKEEMEQRYYWQLQESERKDSLKDKEMPQRYHYQKKEIQKYINQLQEKETKEAQQDQVIQGYCQQLQEKAAKQQELQKYCEKLKEEAEKETRLRQQLQEKEAIKEKEIQRYCQELQEKGEKEAEKEHIYHHQLLEEQRLKEKYFQQLQQKGKELAEKEKKIQMFHHQLREKEREAQEKQRVFCQQFEQKETEGTEKDQEIRRYCHSLQEKDKEEAEREKKYHNQLLEKDRELQEKDMELQEKDRELQKKDRELQEKYKEQAEREESYYNQLQEKDRELQEKAREEAQREQRYHNKLQEKEQEKINLLQKEEKEKAEIEQKYYWQLQENKRKDLVKDEEMRRYTQLLQEKEQEYDQHLQEKVKEIQHYRYQLQKKEQEMQKYTYQLQEKERKETQQDQVIQRYCQLLQEKTAKEQEIQKFCEKLKEEATEKKKRHLQELQEKGKKEAEKKHQLLEEQRLKDKYFQQLQEKGKKLAEKVQEMQMYHQQLQDKEREEAKMKQYYNHELQKIKKELEDKENETQRLNHLLQNRSKELIERDQKIKEHQQQIQQYEHLKDTNIQKEERRVVQDKVEEVKLLHSSEEVEQASESMILSENKEFREDSKLTQKEDGKGNQMHELAQDEPKGVHVAANNIFYVHGGSAQSVKWEEYGIRIKVPQGAVLPSDTVQVTITAFVGGDFIFPEDTELVSAVYAIHTSKPFIEPVKLEIQHCVSIETSSHCNYLSFSTSTNNQPPYQFDTVDGGEFSIGNRYGSISIATFSKYCIKTYSGRRYQPYSIPGTSSFRARSHALSSSLSSSFDGPCLTSSPVSPSSFKDELHSSSSSLELPHTFSTKNDVTILADKPPVKCYHSQLMYEIKRPGREWLMRFLLSKDLNALIEYIRKAFRNAEKSIEVSFQFKDDDGLIELCFDEQCPKGWSVRSHQTPTKVRQNDIDRYGSMSPPRFPEFLITISATPGEDADKELCYPVMLKGVISNVEKINIVLTMGDIQQASVGSITSNSGPISSDDDERKITGKVLRENSDTLLKILAAPNNLSTVIMSFYAKELVSDATVTECMNDGRPIHIRCASLLFALKATIDGKPQAMNTLIEVLKENEAFKEIADKMDLEVSYHTYTNP